MHQDAIIHTRLFTSAAESCSAWRDSSIVPGRVRDTSSKDRCLTSCSSMAVMATGSARARFGARSAAFEVVAVSELAVVAVPRTRPLSQTEQPRVPRSRAFTGTLFSAQDGQHRPQAPGLRDELRLVRLRCVCLCDAVGQPGIALQTARVLEVLTQLCFLAARLHYVSQVRREGGLRLQLGQGEVRPQGSFVAPVRLCVVI